MNLYFRTTHPFYKKMIAMADRYGIRDTALVAVDNGFMYDKGIISEKDRVKLFDRNTVRF